MRVSLIQRAYECIRRFSSKPEERGEYSAGYWQAQIRQEVLRMISPDSGSVLEVGCGEGLFLAQVSSTYEKMLVLGVDNWKDILLKAQSRILEKHLGKVNLFQADASLLPFKDCYFDTVICVNVIFNLKSNEVVNGVLKEMSRVCKNSGRIIFDFRNAWNPLLYLKYKLAPYYDPTVRDLPLRTYRLEQIRSFLNKVGLKITRQKHIGSMIKSLAPIIIIEAKKNDE